LKNIFMSEQIIVLGTGGTIAGTAASSSDHTGYTAAQIGVAALLQGVRGLQAALRGHALLSEQVAQLDSKDMDWGTMLRLAQRCAHHLAQPQVKGIVITHGTDTLEETAYFLHRVIPVELQTKPVVLTCAMRPATSSEADGPRNLHDAVLVARDTKHDGKACGVLVVCAGDVHHALYLQKVHTYALNAFSSGDVAQGEPGVMAQIVGDDIRFNTTFLKEKRLIAVIESAREAIDLIVNPPRTWPRVEIVMNHASASGSIVHALLNSSNQDDPLRGIVVAGTGNGTVSEALQEALAQAQVQGVEVVITSRCAWGGVRDGGEGGTSGSSLSAVKARVELMLRLLGA
jgi:L-asparaginase